MEVSVLNEIGNDGGELTPRCGELEQLYRAQARQNSIQLVTAIRSCYHDNNVDIEGDTMRKVCERYIELFRNFFRAAAFETPPDATRTPDLRKNFSEGNFPSILPIGRNGFERMKSDEAGDSPLSMDFAPHHRTPRKFSIDDEVFLNHDNLVGIGGTGKKKTPLKRWYSRGKKIEENDPTSGEVNCLSNDSINKTTSQGSKMTSVWNRLRRSSKRDPGIHQSKITGSSHDDVIKLERSCEFRVSSSGGHSPFLKARILLRLNGDVYKIEIYCPPKNIKAKHVIDGKDILEVRPTAASKIQQSRNCFLLKSREREFVVKLDSADDVLLWLQEIEDANTRSGNLRPHIYECYKHPYTPEFLKKQIVTTTSSGFLVGSDSSLNSKKLKKTMNGEVARIKPTSPSPPPAAVVNNNGRKTSLPESSTETTNNKVASWSEAVQVYCPEPMGGPQHNGPHQRHDSGEDTTSANCSPTTSTTSSIMDDADHIVLVDTLPWFHGPMSRKDASTLVTNLDDGIFLLRFSTNQNCYVITIAHQGKAKHLRVTIDNEGRCRINDKNFSSVVKMLIFHHKFPISVDSTSSNNKVLLTDFVTSQIHPEYDSSQIATTSRSDMMTSQNNHHHHHVIDDVTVTSQSGGEKKTPRVDV